MRRIRLFPIIMLAAILNCQRATLTFGGSDNPATIVCSTNASQVERLAAKEIRRYLYLRTGKLLPMVEVNNKLSATGQLILVGQKDQNVVKEMLRRNRALTRSVRSLLPQQYRIQRLTYRKQPAVLIAGGDEFGTLYGAYRFIEHFGVRFYLHGDTIPDQKIALELPDLDETGKPLFELRGIHPFHDFPEGPDWWNVDDYKAVIAQLPKLRMNFFGLHCYPEGGVGPEPTVWIGKPEDVGPDGRVKFSHQSRHFTTHGGTWGYKRTDTEDFHFGTSLLFDRNDYGAEYMKGMTPWPDTPEDRSELFNRFGDVLNRVFTLAQKLGVKTCIGTEVPLTIPRLVKDHMKQDGKNADDGVVVQQLYEGMFERIKRTYPLDYYWLWTNEGWTWGGAKDEDVEAVQNDILTALAASQRVKAPFTLATCGWVLGPPKNRAQFDNVLPKEMPFSCINRQVGKAPVEPQFAKVKGRPKWAIPWLEDDPGMISPQLWAGRMRKDALDALKYGCTGLMGIHWRTRILGPNVSALAKAAWDQSLRRKLDEKPAKPKKVAGVVGGQVAHFPNNAIANTEDDVLYQNVRYDVSAYRLKIPNGKYAVTLQFCEPHYGEAGKRVFGVKLQGKRVIEQFDMFAKVGKNKALDYRFEDIEVKDGLLEIDFVKVVEFPCIAAIAVESKTAGVNQDDGQPFAMKINCGGSAYQDYVADLKAAPSEPRFLPADDFYADWALHQFGPDAVESIAEIFTKIDCHLHEPSTWINGPGGIRTSDRPWSKVAKSYDFVDRLAALQGQIQGAGNRERFDYWLNSFRFTKAMAQVGCTLGEMDRLMKQIEDEKEVADKKELALRKAIPLRQQLVQRWGEMVTYLLTVVSNPGEMGTVANIEQHSMGTLQLLNKHDKAIEKALGKPLPDDTQPWEQYRGPTRPIVPTVRTSLLAGEDLRLNVIILAQNKPEKAFLYWRPMGAEKYNKTSLRHVARAVYSATIPASQVKENDLEYHVKVTVDGDRDIYFPATAPQMDQTVVIVQ